MMSQRASLRSCYATLEGPALAVLAPLTSLRGVYDLCLRLQDNHGAQSEFMLQNLERSARPAPPSTRSCHHHFPYMRTEYP